MRSQPAAVLLDRDGTIIVEKEYLSDPAQVSLETGAIEGLALLQRLGHPLVVVSNQSGIGRGFFSQDDAVRVNARVADLLGAAGIEVMGWYMCPHAPDTLCSCRKPLPGLALQAARDFGLDLAGSFVIGDKQSDLEMADAIGGTGILVTTGHGAEAVSWAMAQGRPISSDLFAAAAFVESRSQEFYS